MKIPIVSQADWMELWFIDSDVKEEKVLIEEANRIVNDMNECCNEPLYRVSPKGVEGVCTPNMSITIEMCDSNGVWRKEAQLTIPMVN